MAKYEVLHDFKDLHDKNKIYRAGDVYPNPANKKIKKERIKELSSKENRQNKPLIKEIKEGQE